MEYSKFFPTARRGRSSSKKKPKNSEFLLPVPTYHVIDETIAGTIREGLYRDWTNRYVQLTLDKAVSQDLPIASTLLLALSMYICVSPQNEFARAAVEERGYHPDRHRGRTVRVHHHDQDHEKFYADLVHALLRKYLDAADAPHDEPAQAKARRLKGLCDVLDETLAARSTSPRSSPTVVPPEPKASFA
ncbi:hypothetical protein JCM11491_001202 [Sporobolomyces phaffii]